MKCQWIGKAHYLRNGDSIVGHIAVIGDGIAGGACSRALGLARHSVHVFDKSRDPEAWPSARSLSAALLQRAFEPADGPAALTADMASTGRIAAQRMSRSPFHRCRAPRVLP